MSSDRSSNVPEAPSPRRRPRTSYLVKRLETLLRSRLDAACAQAGITTTQYVALSVLEANGGMSSAELAARSFVSPQSANEVVVLLERRGLIVRVPDGANKRILRTRLTDDGLATLERCELAVDELEAEMFGGTSGLDEEGLRQVLRELIGRLSGAPGAGQARQPLPGGRGR